MKKINGYKSILFIFTLILVMMLFTQQGMAIESPKNEIESQIEVLNQKIENLQISLNDATKELEKLKLSVKESQLNDESKEERVPYHEKGNLMTIYFNSEDISSPSHATSSYIDTKLQETGLKDLGGAFIEAEKLYEINAIALCALAMHESNKGMSKIALDKNNLFGFGAYNGNPYFNAFTYESKEQCILQVAKFLSEQYLSEDGKYYRGKGLEDMNVAYAVNDDGSPNLSWSRRITKLANRLLE